MEVVSRRSILMAAVMIMVVAETQSSIHVEGRFKGINQFCMTASKRRLCTRMVHGAINWNQAVKNSIETTIGLANQMQATLPQVVSAFSGLPKVSKDSAIETCQETFSTVSDSLKESLGFLAQNDKGSLNSYLSASLSFGDCEDAFSQFGVDMPPQLAVVMRLITDQIDNCLAISTQE